MNNLIKYLKSKSLSGDDILKLIDYKANLMTYPELTKCDDINKCLGKHGALILLYETKKNYGHWVCLIRHNKKHIEFFDSYNFFPDDELNFIPEKFRKISNQSYPHLTYLLLKSNANIEYNHARLQKFTIDPDEHIATCGRHVATRINLRKIPLDEYIKIMKGNKECDPDTIVTFLTSFL